jgi:hypothetical protein
MRLKNIFVPHPPNIVSAYSSNQIVRARALASAGIRPGSGCEIRDDRAGIGDAEVAVLQSGHLPERAGAEEIGIVRAKSERLMVERNALLGREHENLAHERRHGRTVDDHRRAPLLFRHS